MLGVMEVTEYVIYGIMEGGNNPRRKWLGVIQEWCNMSIYSSFRAELDRDLWAAIVGAAVDTMDYRKRIDPPYMLRT